MANKFEIFLKTYFKITLGTCESESPIIKLLLLGRSDDWGPWEELCSKSSRKGAGNWEH